MVVSQARVRYPYVPQSRQRVVVERIQLARIEAISECTRVRVDV